jgi:hypothetical protein
MSDEVRPQGRAEIEVTAENQWFLERYLNVFDFLNLFPPDAVGDATTHGVPIVLETDLGFDIVSDIDSSKMQLRNRSKFYGWTRWIREHGLNLGDRIVIERTGERSFSLRLELKQSISD